MAGACNIGREEITRRRNVGWVGVGLTFILLAILIMIGAGRWWRLFVFVPAALSASGFLQARMHFCAGFARIGIYNFGSIGEKHNVPDVSSKAKDRKRGNQISLYAALIGIVTAVICVIL